MDAPTEINSVNTVYEKKRPNGLLYGFVAALVLVVGGVLMTASYTQKKSEDINSHANELKGNKIVATDKKTDRFPNLTANMTVAMAYTNQTTVTFNELAGNNTAITGQYPTGVISWDDPLNPNTHYFLTSPSCCGFNSKNISYLPTSTSAQKGKFFFINPKVLVSIKAYSKNSPATITLACPNENLVMNTSIKRNRSTLITTNWTNACTMVVLTSTTGQNTYYDDLTIADSGVQATPTPTSAVTPTSFPTPTPTRVPTATPRPTATPTLAPSASPAPTTPTSPTPTQTPGGLLGLHVSGNNIYDSNNQLVRLHGTWRSGSEYACVGSNGTDGYAIFDGPVDNTSIQAIKAWKQNVVEVTLNEHCWLGKSYVNPAYSGANYRNAIVDYVHRIEAAGMYVIVDDHYSAPNGQVATEQQDMPNADNTPAFWTSVAQTFGNDTKVLFDLYDEPRPDYNRDTTAAWTCLKNGGTCSGISFATAGTQSLVNAVRNAGGQNIIMVPGVMYSSRLSHWLQYKPTDPMNNLAASWSIWNLSGCDSTCWDQETNPVTLQNPVVAGFGEIHQDTGTCEFTFSEPLLTWLDARSQHYLQWAWSTYSCTGFPGTLTNYNGTPNVSFGSGYKSHLNLHF